VDAVAVLGLAAGVALVVVWAAANRGHVRRHADRPDEWSGTRPDLWTSAARCPECGAGGGLVEQEGDGVRFTCLRCGATHRREHRA